MPDSTWRPEHECRKEFAHALLFTGHMIDRTDRDVPRFPPSAESRVRSAIHSAILRIAWEHSGATVGLAGGASGGDILFHECCEELGIPTHVLLGLPPAEFERVSVAPAGEAWIRRFRALLEKAGTGPRIMPHPDKLSTGVTENLWQRTNLWMIEEAGRLASEQVLLALWDGRPGDGPGGAEQFIQAARKNAIPVLRIAME